MSQPAARCSTLTPGETLRRTAGSRRRFLALLLSRHGWHGLGRRAVDAGIYGGEVARVVGKRLQLRIAELALSVRGHPPGPAAMRTFVGLRGIEELVGDLVFLPLLRE